MLGAEIDFIVLEYDSISNIAIASRIEAMELRSSIEIPKLKVNDTIKVRKNEEKKITAKEKSIKKEQEFENITFDNF